MSGEAERAETFEIPYYRLKVPYRLSGVDESIMDPANTYDDPSEWDRRAKDLAGRFIANFNKYESNERCRMLAKSGPML